MTESTAELTSKLTGKARMLIMNYGLASAGNGNAIAETGGALMAYVAGLESEVQEWKGISQDWCQQSHDNKAAYDKLFAEWEAANDWQRERAVLYREIERLRAVEARVFGLIAMGDPCTAEAFSDLGPVLAYSIVPGSIEDEDDPPIEREGRTE